MKYCNYTGSIVQSTSINFNFSILRLFVCIFNLLVLIIIYKWAIIRLYLIKITHLYSI